MLKAIKIKLYPNQDQMIYINKLLGSCRFIYNNCLSYKIESYNKDKHNISFGELGKYLTNLKQNKDYVWLNESHSKVLQQTIINLEYAYKSFFKNGNGFPKFKSKKDTKQSCRFPVDAIMSIKGNRINIIKTLKDIHFKCSIRDEKYLNKNQHLIKSATLVKTKSNNYYFSILIEGSINKQLSKPINNIKGIDLGIKDFIVTSNGERYDNLKIVRNNEKKLKKLQRQFSRKKMLPTGEYIFSKKYNKKIEIKKSSNNKEKCRIKLAKYYQKLNNIKENYLHSIVNQLLNENQVIVIENLDVKQMLGNHTLAKSISELSLNRFKNILKYKAEWYGRDIIEIDKYFPSSKLCNVCNYKNNDLTLKDRNWVCPQCKSVHDRDLNASINIRNEGKRILDIQSIDNKSNDKIPNNESLNKNVLNNNFLTKDVLNKESIGLSSPELTLMESISLETR